MSRLCFASTANHLAGVASLSSHARAQVEHAFDAVLKRLVGHDLRASFGVEKTVPYGNMIVKSTEASSTPTSE